MRNCEPKIHNRFRENRDGTPFLIRTVEAHCWPSRSASPPTIHAQRNSSKGNATKSELEADALSLKSEQLALGQYQEDLRLIKKLTSQSGTAAIKVEQAKSELDRLKQRTSNEIAQAEADLKTSQGALGVPGGKSRNTAPAPESTKILAPRMAWPAQVSPFQTAGGDDRRQ